jgi:hypothetical protein
MKEISGMFRMGAKKVNNLLIKYKPDFMVRFCYANSNIFLKKIVRKQQLGKSALEN